MSSSRICVAVRKRPTPDVDKDIVVAQSPYLVVNEPKVKYDLTPYTERHQFTYDQVLDENSNNALVYQRCCSKLIDTLFNHGNATCFAYGQTGSGKTHTMLGNDHEPGLYAIAAKDIFSRAAPLNAEVYISFYEIYGRKIFDLLNNKERLVAREDAEKVINICGLSEHKVTDIQGLFDIISRGSAYRAAGQTSANSESSRSHAVLQMEIREVHNRRAKTIGRISFIDLAGNERGADTFDCDRKTRMEGADINKSLLALKECIRALGMGKSHVPFRGSILTEVLRDSFVGNSRTTMIATISPTSAHCVNTLNTLRYTQRVKDLGGESKSVPVEKAERRPVKKAKPFEAPPPIKSRPEWVDNFLANEGEHVVEDDGNSSGEQAKPQPKQRVNRPLAGKESGQKSEIVVRDPKIATIVQNHIDALQDGSDEEDEEEEEHAPQLGLLAKSEEKQVRKVHAHVLEEISRAEEKLVAFHRRHIDTKMTGIKEEIRAIQAFEDSDFVDEYVNRVRTLLMRQKQDVETILGLLNGITGMLREEEELSSTLTTSLKVHK
ncbi:putative MCAK-like kinesin [Trypanosoma conorhini]|uniref:Kinesin-like protein n=1 Tax=Trypanosoma conorhini TaxID=83891 RepID=A0A3R7NBP9_9TRYP|nr:putative MCAK-like kinesin [Trypanosoma conorhini]RNF16203.1 putative MCAK-like kinesin [Trypanosoma conorhini]